MTAIIPQKADDLTWRAQTPEASALVSLFAAQRLEIRSDIGESWTLHALSVVVPNDTVRAIVAQLANNRKLKLISELDPLTRVRQTAFVYRMFHSKSRSQIRWARPKLELIADHIREAAIYSRLLETRYLPDNSEGDEFVAPKVSVTCR